MLEVGSCMYLGEWRTFVGEEMVVRLALKLCLLLPTGVANYHTEDRACLGRCAAALAYTAFWVSTIMEHP